MVHASKGARGSILLREHDGDDAPRRLGVARVFRAAGHVAVVAIHFPEDTRAVVLERAEVVLARPVVLDGQ